MKIWSTREHSCRSKSSRSKSKVVSRQMRLEQLEHRFAMDTGGMMGTATNLGAVDGQTIGIEEAISTSTDVDLFVFQAKAGQTVEFDIDTPQNGPEGWVHFCDYSMRQVVNLQRTTIAPHLASNLVLMRIFRIPSIKQERFTLVSQIG